MGLKQNNKAMGEEMLSDNIDKSVSFYTQDVISMPNNGKMLEGKEAIKLKLTKT
jgi:hypothetical protein